MAAALDNFERMLGGGEGRPGLALLGEMRELGADSSGARRPAAQAPRLRRHSLRHACRTRVP